MIDRPEMAVLNIHLLAFQIQIPIRSLKLLQTERVLLILELGNRRECEACCGLHHPLLLLWFYQILVRDTALLKFDIPPGRYRGKEDRVILITYLLRNVLRLLLYLRESLEMSAPKSSPCKPGRGRPS